MNILILGSGGREHALAWKIAKSKKINKLYIAPGNPGTDQCGINIPITPGNFESIKELVLKYKINIVVVGPEEPLVNGIYDFFKQDEHLQKTGIIGPSAQGALLEGSKSYAKSFMIRNNIPTARYKSVSINNTAEGIDFMKTLNPPYVLKADGLAAGKGVVIVQSFTEAVEMIYEMLKGKFGKSSENIVIEEFLDGIEVSVFIITDGKSYILLPEAKDYKRAGEKNTGLNTGGMGSVSPVPFADKEFMKKVQDRIIIPTIKGLNNESIDYKGFIFFGLIKVKGEPYVIEYNARLGDPETEAILPRIKSDIVDLFEGVINGDLEKRKIEITEKTAVNIMLTSHGYPQEFQKGFEILNIEKVEESIVFHSGTSRKEGELITSGGRVLSVTSLGNNLEEAVERSLKSADLIDYANKYYRKDIGFDII
jgi:phosphoribosylamine---glycine ligase